MSLLSYGNTRESLGELEKAVELTYGWCSQSISQSPKLPLVLDYKLEISSRSKLYLADILLTIAYCYATNYH